MRRRRFTLEELNARVVPTYLGNQLFPLDNPWNQDVSAAPVAANSAAVIGAIVTRHGGTAPRVHADWGNPLDENLYGIPINVATSSTPRYDIYFPAQGYEDESDVVPVPIPDNAVIEGDFFDGPSTPDDRGDSHMLVYDRDANVLYELYQAIRPNELTFPYGGTKPAGVWGAYQISVWDLNANSFRTIKATSADAAGLPIMPGLVRPDEVNPPAEGGVGVIDHAIRMTVVRTRDEFVYPASHEASSRTDSNLPRMGERFRLKASFAIPADWSPEAKAIATAMKTYGLIVADNGSDFYFQGVPSTAWDMEEVLEIQQLRANDFEVVDLTPRVTGLNATAGNIAGGTTVTITGNNFGGTAGELDVLFGTVPASSVTIVSSTQLIAVAPAHAAGTVDVRVRSGSMREDTDGNDVFFGYGTSPVVTAACFTYKSPPTAAADTYQTGKGKPLNVLAKGVLKNDTDADGDAITARLVSPPANGTVALNANGSFRYVPNTGFIGTDTFTYVANDKTFDSAPAAVNVAVAAPPEVTNVVVNDGTAQRSEVRSITLTFDAPVTFDAGAFRVVRSNGTAAGVVRTVTQANGETYVVLTFRGLGTNAGSLADGNWTLKVVKSRVHRADYRPQVMEADHLTTLHRLYGDANGDRTVDATDEAAFLAALGETDVTSLATFDYNRDGVIDGLDQVQFNRRMGRTV